MSLAILESMPLLLETRINSDAYADAVMAISSFYSPQRKNINGSQKREMGEFFPIATDFGYGLPTFSTAFEREATISPLINEIKLSIWVQLSLHMN